MIEELKARMAWTLDEWREFEPEDDWSGYQRDHKLAFEALAAALVMKEALENATAMIGHKMPMDATALVAGEILVARDVWKAGLYALAALEGK
jgi:hypothetical protein